jgi:FkbM family methyltransferase
MNSIVRPGLSIKTAFKSGFKRKMLLASRHDDIVESAPISIPPALKKFLYVVAKYVYRFSKPVIRPIAFRIRRYLIDGLRREIQQEIQRASVPTLDSFQQLRGVLWPRLDRIEAHCAAAARRIAMNCGAGEVLVRTEVGFLLCAASDHALLLCLLETGEVERGTRVLIQKYLRPGDVYVDVGANIGMHTLAAARAMQGQGKIIAFEPFEPTMRMLEKSIWMNGFSSMTEIHQAAVSNATGHQRLFIGAVSGHHSLFPLGASPNNAHASVDVPLVRLDGVIPPGQRIDLIKIDAEGAELEVIEGGASLITCNPEIALIVEFGPPHLRRIGRTPNQWFKSFSQLGLDYRVINNESGALEKWSLDTLEQVESVNLFFALPGSTAWDRLS